MSERLELPSGAVGSLRDAQRPRLGREPNGSRPTRDHDGRAEGHASDARAQSRNLDVMQGEVIGFMQTHSTKGHNTFDPKRRSFSTLHEFLSYRNVISLPLRTLPNGAPAPSLRSRAAFARVPVTVGSTTGM